MQPDDLALSFACQGEQLIGILSPGAAGARRGVLVIVGGPQYRAGSHRQFTLLARALAAQGIPAMRFDYRGMGDSAGAFREFEAVDADVRAAVDQFMAAVPGLEEVVLWGLCDAASAALFYAQHDARVAGLVLLNPWARTADGYARATLKHYYLQRLMQPELWRKIVRGQFDAGAALRSLRQLLGAARQPASAPATANAEAAATIVSAQPSAVPAIHGSLAPHSTAIAAASAGAATSAVAITPATAAAATSAAATKQPELAPLAPAAVAAPAGPGLHARMLSGMQGFSGPVLLIISATDLTAREFLDMAQASKPWRKLLSAKRVRRHTLDQADHTFSTRAWRDQVASWTADWVQSW